MASRRSQATAVVILALGLLGLGAVGFLRFGVGGVSAMHSRSMSHSDDAQRGVLDPGEWFTQERVDERSDIITYFDAELTGHRVGRDWGDVIVYDPVGTGIDDPGLRIAHRAIIWVEYNATSDAYDVPGLGLKGTREFVLPPVGTWDPSTRRYLAVPVPVRLAPETAGRHDGFLTKGDHNQGADQDWRGRLGTLGQVELVELATIDGKIVRHVDGDRIYLTVGVAILAAAVGTTVILARRRGRRMLPGKTRCTSCGRAVVPESPFCAGCGTVKPR